MYTYLPSSPDEPSLPAHTSVIALQDMPQRRTSQAAFLLRTRIVADIDGMFVSPNTVFSGRSSSGWIS